MLWLVRASQKHLGFDPLARGNKGKVQWIWAWVLTIGCVLLNAMDWGTLKILGEWQRKGPWLFLFQYLYYLAEVGLIFLIVAFGQKWREGLLEKKTVFPFGGLVLCCTWGMIHIFSQGSLYTGAGVMAFSLCDGGIYLLLGRDGLKSYGMMALAFLL